MKKELKIEIPRNGRKVIVHKEEAEYMVEPDGFFDWLKEEIDNGNEYTIEVI